MSDFLCQDCVHCIASTDKEPILAKCRRFTEVFGPNPVDGSVEMSLALCAVERLQTGRCRPQALAFESMEIPA